MGLGVTYPLTRSNKNSVSAYISDVPTLKTQALQNTWILLDPLPTRPPEEPEDDASDHSDTTNSESETADDNKLCITAGLIIGAAQAFLKVWHVVASGTHIICFVVESRATKTTLKVQNECGANDACGSTTLCRLYYQARTSSII
jgi:hypothetical protein